MTQHGKALFFLSLFFNTNCGLFFLLLASLLFTNLPSSKSSIFSFRRSNNIGTFFSSLEPFVPSKNNNKSSIAHCTQIMKIVDKAKRRNKRQLSNSSSAHERTTLIEFPPPPSSIPYHIIISNVENEIRPIERRCLPPPIGRSRGTRQLRVQCLWIKKEETR